MKRNNVKTIIAFWLYVRRKDAGLEEFGNANTDQDEADRIIKFFDEMKINGAYKNWEWEKTYEDYRQFQNLYDEISDG